VPLLVQSTYNKANSDYAKAFADYKVASVSAANSDANNSIRSTYALLQEISDMTKKGRDVVLYFKNKSVTDHWQPARPDLVDQNVADLLANLNVINGYLGDLGVIVNTIGDQSGNAV